MKIEGEWPVYAGTDCCIRLCLKEDHTFELTNHVWKEDDDTRFDSKQKVVKGAAVNALPKNVQEEVKEAVATCCTRGSWTRDGVIIKLLAATKHESFYDQECCDKLSFKSECYPYVRIQDKGMLVMKPSATVLCFGPKSE